MDDAPAPMFEARFGLNARVPREVGFAHLKDGAIRIVDEDALQPLSEVPLGTIAAIRLGYPQARKGHKRGGHVVLGLRDGSELVVQQAMPIIRTVAQMTAKVMRPRNEENEKRYRAFVRDLLAEADRRGIAVTGGDGRRSQATMLGVVVIAIGLAMIVLLGFWQGVLVLGLGGLVFVAIGTALIGLGRRRAARPIGRDTAALEPFMPGPG